ncbi:hypothetical protein E3T28_13930 [Cryobacterium sinapicolor]|uniref:DUF222 domain-containing protein n=1 Tax=Cryobacterium sinapicolor TaxID=1259236 RepID=A0ABY2IVF2_9MICO|nr:hypothetical protein [Cryobacterium sinapicolor]TFC95577.1 hypothetical protein E3T28_13930 [Cryobacterium sinapicolor]
MRDGLDEAGIAACEKQAYGEHGPAEPAAHGQIEGNPVPISLETIDRILGATGIRATTFDTVGQIVNVGLDERPFTDAQRAAMVVRDGGCLWLDCDRAPAGIGRLGTDADRTAEQEGWAVPPGLDGLDTGGA